MECLSLCVEFEGAFDTTHTHTFPYFVSWMLRDHGLVNRTVRAGVYKVGQVLTQYETPARTVRRKFEIQCFLQISADFARMSGSS